MENVKNKKSKKNIVINVVTYSLIGILLVFAVIGFILKVSANTVTIFNTRFDVVLTDSMSVKNPEYVDFLQGHDNQIQPMDVVLSTTNISEEDLNVYDIVLFNNRELGATDMHRIVGKTLRTSDDIEVLNASTKEINGKSGIYFKAFSGGIVSNVISAEEITLVTFSSIVDRTEHFSFSHSSASYPATVTFKEADGGLYTTYVVKIDSTSPRKLVIAHKSHYDYSSEIISSCIIKSYYGDIDLKLENLTIKDDGYSGTFNKTYYYEIRGDKSNTSDGTKFTKDDIYSKVVSVVPKIGFIIRYLSSVPGMIMLIGMGVIIIVYDVVASRLDKRKKIAESCSESTNEDEVVNMEGEDEKKQNE